MTPVTILRDALLSFLLLSDFIPHAQPLRSLNRIVYRTGTGTGAAGDALLPVGPAAPAKHTGTCREAIVSRNLKLPVWPVWAGVLIQLADWLKAKALSEMLWSSVGGRVVPISLSPERSPFLLLAHHAHTFSKWDPFRPISAAILPEGFPAHPHAGFDTVTYCIEGGLRHRDSEGCKQRYGDGEVQWMRAGRGIIHEEMWDVFSNPQPNHRIELFQIWVNLPSRSKLASPDIKLLRSNDVPIVTFPNSEAEVKVICGEISQVDSAGTEVVVCGPGNSMAAESDVSILHWTQPTGLASFAFEVSPYCEVIVYVRRGSLIVQSSMRQGESDDSSSTGITTEVFPGDHVRYGSTAGQQSSVICLTSGPSGFDGLLLIGAPLGEPVINRGPFVASSEEELFQQARTFEELGRDAFWDFKMSDSDWLTHVKQLKQHMTD